jgi:hypothetical protein
VLENPEQNIRGKDVCDVHGEQIGSVDDLYIDRLGLLGEGSLIPTLGSRPDLRWLVDEVGARWDILSSWAASASGGHSRRPSSGCSRPDLTPREPRPTYATSGYLLYRMQQDRKECATMGGFLTKILVATDGSEHAFLAARAGVDPIRAPGSSTMEF